MNIYVGNLNYKVEHQNLTEVFSEYGSVSSAKVILDKDSGRSKGFGFIEMPNEEEAIRAIEELNQAELMGRKMVVNQAKSKN